MLGKEEFNKKVLSTFGDDVSSERLDMMYKNYLFNELGRNQIYGVTGGANLEFSSYNRLVSPSNHYLVSNAKRFLSSNSLF